MLPITGQVSSPSRKLSAACAVTILVIITTALTLPFTRHVYSRDHTGPLAETKYSIYRQPEGPQFEIVLSHYDFDPHVIKRWTSVVREVPLIKNLGSKVIIYTKGSMNITELKEKSGAEEVYTLPNIGREGETMLHHITTRYDNISRFTLFSQASTQGALDDFGFPVKRGFLEGLFALTNDTGYLSLSNYNPPCSCGFCDETEGVFRLEPIVYTKFFGEACHKASIRNLFGQFIVSSDRIRQNAINNYEWLHGLIAAPEEHWIHQEAEPWQIRETYMEGGRSHPSNPLFGHTLERSWNTIFNCAFPDEHDCNQITGCHCKDPVAPSNSTLQRPSSSRGPAVNIPSSKAENPSPTTDPSQQRHPTTEIAESRPVSKGPPASPIEKQIEEPASSWAIFRDSQLVAMVDELIRKHTPIVKPSMGNTPAATSSSVENAPNCKEAFCDGVHPEPHSVP